MPARAEPDGVRPGVRGILPPGITHLGLAHLVPKRFLSTATTALYRHIARLVDLGPETEFLVVPSGRGLTAQLLAELTGGGGAGVAPDAELVNAANDRARSPGLAQRLQSEVAPLTALPYQDEASAGPSGEAGPGSAEAPGEAIGERVRVTKPMGYIVPVQFTWTGNVDAEERRSLSESLGVRPLLLVECKQLLREAGVVDLYVEDWSDVGGGERHPWPIGALQEDASLRDRASLIWRAWRQWGWEGARAALSSRGTVRDLLAKERVLGLSVIRGARWHEEEGEREE